MTCPQGFNPTACRACRAGATHTTAPTFTYWSHDAGYPTVEAFDHASALATFRENVLAGRYPNVPTFTYLSEEDVAESTSTVYTVK
jgi:hypothetical protein